MCTPGSACMFQHTLLQILSLSLSLSLSLHRLADSLRKSLGLKSEGAGEEDIKFHEEKRRQERRRETRRKESLLRDRRKSTKLLFWYVEREREREKAAVLPTGWPLRPMYQVCFCSSSIARSLARTHASTVASLALFRRRRVDPERVSSR